MSATAMIELEHEQYFDSDGKVVTVIYQKGFEEPLMVIENFVSDLVLDFVEDTEDDAGFIETSHHEEIAYEIMDDLQYAYDTMNNAIRDEE